MKLFNRTAAFNGAYFGSHPDFPKPSKVLGFRMTDKGIVVNQGFKTHPPIAWDQVKGFDYTGDITNGSFNVTLTTVNGSFEVEVSSIHVGSAGDQKMWAASKRDKLNKCKRYVLEHIAKP
jgi:hypothetical protein